MSDSRSIKVKIMKENARTVVVRLVSLNRSMPVPKKEFDKRVEDGMYEVVGETEETLAD
ncbi:MAG: hypothetical protein H6577_13150 [Lewinellaceae bacterium]|nr:hypothetical protein [Saprospiraceae bacterium]MCB9339071.1 hypothetical protein [Lewinellaceae bacterium]